MEFFNRFGLVVDIYVPLKRSKGSRRFGFVRYKGVVDVNDLILKNKKIAVGADPITINAAKFKSRTTKTSATTTTLKDYHVSPAWKKLPPPPPCPKGSFVDVLSFEDLWPASLLEPEIFMTIGSRILSSFMIHLICFAGMVSSILRLNMSVA